VNGAGTTVTTAPVLPEGPPPPRLSLLRVLLALVVLAGVAGSAAYAISRQPTRAAAISPPRFAPYVDVTLTPTYAFQSPAANPVQRVVLGFVVAAPGQPCAPSWGGYYTPAAAESALDLDQRVRQVEAQGGLPAISFGGEANTELAVGCTSASMLAAAYQDVLARYHATDADFDIEGAALGDAAANARRAVAIATVQRRMAASGSPLRVWLTLPVTPRGLTSESVAAVRAVLAAHVAIDGVNVLAMDFTPTASVRHHMLAAVESAASRTHSQLEALFAQVRLPSASTSVWAHLGVTVMIGRNDTAGEVFSLADARGLAAFVTAHGIAQVSMWSLNRDAECGSVFAQVGTLSNTCSGVTQGPLAFSNVFRNLRGTVTARSEPAAPVLAPTSTAADNPASSPYPVWRSDAAYPGGYKVVWHHAVYEALWFSTGVAPDTPAQGPASSPWLLLGPVLAGEHPPSPALLDRSGHPAWSPSAVYRAGARVLYQGLPFQAKWYSQGAVPDTGLPASQQSPWLPLFTFPGEPAS
jgi:chitinase